ncbi:MAG: aspartyl protease family protein [Alphaproteobacteria bacterium]|nr:aspartyl protease family protein [Alphaproteobacteria bacterium]MDE2492888.1 aspartyl protease family protein [Alphaproteobacteria bacterium]
MLSIEKYSRRQLVSHGAASLLFASMPARAQRVPAGAPQPPSLTRDVTKVTADTNAANLLTTNVQINGRGPFQFVVDTGADRTVIADDVVAAQGLPKGGHVAVEGAVRTVIAETARVEELAFGPVSCEDLVLPVLPRAQLEADGYLGLDVIDGYRVTFDFKNHALLVTEPRQAQLLNWAPPDETLVRVSGRSGHLRAFNCIVDGVRATTFVDTGAEVSVGNSSLYEALIERSPSYAKKDVLPLTGVTGGIVTGRITTIKNIRLSALTFENSDIAIADLQIFDLWGLAERPSLLIGMNWLRQFSHVSIDYGRKELRFDLARLVVARRA